MASQFLKYTTTKGRLLLHQHWWACSLQGLGTTCGRSKEYGSIFKRKEKHDLVEHTNSKNELSADTPEDSKSKSFVSIFKRKRRKNLVKHTDTKNELIENEEDSKRELSIEEKFNKGTEIGKLEVLRKVSNEQKLEFFKEDWNAVKEGWHKKFTFYNFMTHFDSNHLDYWTLVQFDSEEAVNSWEVSCDSDAEIGYSSAKFELSKNKTGIFHGYIDTRVPKTGKQTYAGYASISSLTPKEPFQNIKKPIDWPIHGFNSLCLRVRGDGRVYMVVLQMHCFITERRFDQFQYPLHTRGGPYWQFTQIPFSKFFLTAYGRIQDRQCSLADMRLKHKIQNVIITLADSNTGPFKLEVDFVGLMKDDNHTEFTAYEMYQTELGQAGY